MTAISSFQTDDLGFEPSPSQRVLVVEDESDRRQLNTDVLIDAGYQVDVADDGTTAWAALQSSQYDLLITDQFLPKLSGVELLKKIHDARMSLPVIMVTENLPTWGFALHPCLQAVTMLRKPYSMGKFLGTVKSVLAKTAPVGAGIAPSKLERELAAVGFPQ
jgi:two-component system alkaline phosphatase synthesis response regulator PhoP